MKNQPDYRFSEHVKVPDEWIERALAVPSTPAGRPHGFSQRSRRLAAAASVVLVMGLSISLYFLTRNINNNSDAVAPYAEPTEEAAAPATSDSQSQPSVTSPEPSAVTTDAPIIPPTRPDSSEAAPSEPTPSAPTLATTVNPTEPTHPGSYEPPTQPVIPPATQPVTPPATQPTEPATAAPAASTEQPVDLPTEPIEMRPDAEKACIEVYVPVDFPMSATASDQSEEFYCRIYNSSGTLIGDSNLFAASHRADLLFTEHGPFIYFQQEIPEAGYSSINESYQYVIYNESGAVFKSGKVVG